MNASHCGVSLSKQYAKGYTCACAVHIHTCLFVRLAEVSKSLIRGFLNRSSLCSAVSESWHALSLFRLRWSLLSLSHWPLVRRLAKRRHVLFHKIHTVNYKSKTNTETVWQYFQTFQAVHWLPVDFLCDIGSPTYFVWPSAVCGSFSCSYKSHVHECDIGSPTYFVWPSVAHRWGSHNNQIDIWNLPLVCLCGARSGSPQIYNTVYWKVS